MESGTTIAEVIPWGMIKKVWKQVFGINFQNIIQFLATK